MVYFSRYETSCFSQTDWLQLPFKYWELMTDYPEIRDFVRIRFRQLEFATRKTRNKIDSRFQIQFLNRETTCFFYTKMTWLDRYRVQMLPRAPSVKVLKKCKL